MNTSRIGRTRSAAALLALVLAAGAVTLTAGTPAARGKPSTDPRVLKASGDRLGSHDRGLLAQAEAGNEPRVMVMIATNKGKAKRVAADLRELGGEIGKRVDRLGYVRAWLPTSAVRKAAKLPGITAIDLNDTVQLPDPRPDLNGAGSSVALATVPGPGPSTPAANPYMPTNETGAVSFTQTNPNWDGRGVTIGVMDSGVDLDSPALQATTTGERKIVDWFTATDPLGDGDGTWRAMLTEVAGPRFTYVGADWTAPAGYFRVDQFSESATAGGDTEGDVNRDGDTTDDFGILYNPLNHDIRVDANQNRDFTDDPAMAPYAANFDVGHFGVDDPATAVREQVPFVVEYREDVDLSPVDLPGVADFVNIGIVSSSHGTHVAGITAANDMLGNADFDGAAPGAKIVSARACTFAGGCTEAALLDGMIELVANRHVDVVNVSIGGLPALNYADPRDGRVEIYNRLIDIYGVELFIAAGNEGPGINTMGDPGVIDDVVTVAASVSKETWLHNYGSVVRKPNNLFNFSSRGPNEDGGFKPNIAAPGAAISTIPAFMPGEALPGIGYVLPPGYAMYNGTSMAAPQATGAAALLLSAAKATDRGVSPAALRRAIYTSARWIDGVPAHGQGNGQFNVPGAWEVLADRVATRRYTSSAPVCTMYADKLSKPGRGAGIYNRCAVGAGGVRSDTKRVFTVHLTRKSGPARPIAHSITWVGNDGAFSSRRDVVLRLNKPVGIKVTFRAGTGVHSAIMRIDDPTTSTVDFDVLNTVVVSNKLEAPEYRWSTESVVDRTSNRSYFISVPAGAKALQINMSGIATGAQTRFIAIDPSGIPAEPAESPLCYTNYSDAATCKPQERSYADPRPGLWEIEVEARRTSPALENPFTLTARAQGTTVDPAAATIPSATAGEINRLTWKVSNDFGPIAVMGQGGPLGSSVSERPTLAKGDQKTYEIEVPEGSTGLDVSIGDTSDAGADLDLYVIDSVGKAHASADGDSEESVSISNPAPGTYKVIVDGYSVPRGRTEFDYRDVFYSPAFGWVAVPAKVYTLTNGGKASITGAAIATAAPTAGRELFGEMNVVTSDGAFVGTGRVVIGAVR